jgi:hypothetical protein
MPAQPAAGMSRRPNGVIGALPTYVPHVLCRLRHLLGIRAD